MIVHAKIFPHRKLNPDKGRIEIPDAPPPRHVDGEERTIMRELIKEEREAQLVRRAAALLNESKANRPIAPPRYTFYFQPELVMAFYRLPSAIWKRELRAPDHCGPSPNEALKASVPWIKKFMRGKPFYCSCGLDITAATKDLVPYQITATGPLSGPYEIKGRCFDCWDKRCDGMVSYISSSRIVCLLSE